MKRHIFLKRLLPFSLIAILLLLTGCLDRSETIVVDKQGNTTITAEFSGKKADFEKSRSYPTAQLWNITKNETSKGDDGSLKLDLTADQHIDYGKSIPEIFTEDSTSAFSLHFPTSVRMWKEGNKTYYQFNRSYKARMFARFNGPEESDKSDSLEKKISEKGIFNVSEKERSEYIQDLKESLMYHNYFIYDEALGVMIRNDAFSVKEKNEVDEKMQEIFESNITEAKLLAILALPDSSIESEYNKLLSLIEKKIVELVSNSVGSDQSQLGSPFQTALEQIHTTYDITEALISDKFSIYLQLPGEILSTNGYTDFDKPGQVYWEFDGTALKDKDIPLYAISVVEK